MTERIVLTNVRTESDWAGDYDVWEREGAEPSSEFGEFVLMSHALFKELSQLAKSLQDFADEARGRRAR